MEEWVERGSRVDVLENSVKEYETSLEKLKKKLESKETECTALKDKNISLQNHVDKSNTHHRNKSNEFLSMVDQA